MNRIYSRQRSLKTTVLASIVTTTLLVVSPGLFEVSAQQSSSSYNIQHNFWFWPGWWPSWGINQPPEWQPPWWFVPQGVGIVWANTQAFSPESGWRTDNDWRFGPMPPLMFLSATATATSDGSQASANASVLLQTPPYSWGPVWGTLNASGSATADTFSGFAHANSSATLWLWGGPGIFWRWGWWRWQPWIYHSVSGSASATWPRRRDPINYVLTDPNTGVTESGELLHINLDGVGDGFFEWTNGIVTMTPSTNLDSVFTLEIQIQNGPSNNYITNIGLLRLTYTGNTVTESTNTGQFADWQIPPVGYTGTVTFTNPPIEFGVDWQRDVDARVGIFGGNGLQPVTLSATFPPEQIEITWPPVGPVYQLETTTNLADTNAWTVVTNAMTLSTNGWRVLLDRSDPMRFYGLKYTGN